MSDLLTTSVFGNQSNPSLFDSFVNQQSFKPPTYDHAFNNKENILKRSNFHLQSKNTLDSHNDTSISRSKINRSNSTSVLVIKALQNKVSDLTTQIQKVQQDNVDKIRDKDEMILHLQNIYQQMQKQYSNIEQEHRGLIPILNQYQQDIIVMRQNKELQMKDLQSNYEESIQVTLRKVQADNSQMEEKLKQLQTSHDQLEENLNLSNQDSKREKQLAQRTKQDYLSKLDQNDQQFEEQIDHYQKINSQLQNQLQKLILSEANWEKQKQILQLTFSQEKQILEVKHYDLAQENEELKELYGIQMRSMEQDVQSYSDDCKNKNQQLGNENDNLRMTLQKIERENFDTVTLKNQENFQLISMIDAVKEDVRKINEQLTMEQYKNLKLESQLQAISGQIQFSKLSQPLDSSLSRMSTTPKKIGSMSTTPKKQSLNVSTYRDSSEIKAQDKKDRDYQDLLELIVVTEKRAFQLNQEYQQLFATFSGEGNSQNLKVQMNHLMEKIKQSNSQLYDLKTKEFSMLSYQ